MYAYVNMTRTTAQFILCLKQRETPKASSLGKGILYTLSSYMGANDNLDNLTRWLEHLLLSTSRL